MKSYFTSNFPGLQEKICNICRHKNNHSADDLNSLITLQTDLHGSPVREELIVFE